MKLLKKLLPIATIASAATVVAPIVTSCSNITIPKDYTPTVKQHDEKQFETEEAGVTSYFTDAANKKEIIIQDVYWTLAQSISVAPESLNPKVSAKVDSIIINTTNKLISCNFYVKEEASGTAEGKTGSSTIELEYKMTSIPYSGRYVTMGDKKVWNFYVDPIRDNWTNNTKVVGRVVEKVTVDGKSTTDVDTKTHTIEKMTLIRPQEVDINIVLDYIASVNWSSYYFAKCSVK